MKQALCNLVRLANANELDYKLVGNIHDEIQSEVRNDHTEAFGKLAVQAVVEAGVQLNLRCPLAAEYKIGRDWSETH
jgi:DNA polymerase I-like protein with 3'-5' exonuclease and polymerase domains